MPTLATNNPAPTVVSDDVDLPPKFPELPDDVLKRFPSLSNWEEDADGWWSRTYNAIQGNNRFVSQSVTRANHNIGDLRVSVDGATAAIATETAARITADEILAQRIVTVSAIAGVAQNILVQGTPPVGPVLNDYWVDNADLLNPVTYQWNGVAWVEVTDPISVAAVAAEQTARITADGNLSGKYTLTVIAGNVVTGMNITSSTGGGMNISSVIFRATDFQIYNGVLGKTMFSVSGTDVQLAGVLTVSTSGKVYLGTGTYGNTNTAWYVDSAGKFSLKDTFTWDGTNLAIAGNNITFASTNRVLATDSASFTTWQGPSGANTAGFYTQQSAAGGGFSAYGVGGGSPLVGLYRSAGSYGAPSNLSANSLIGTVFVEGYVSGAYNEVGRLQWGTIATGNTNYFKIEVSDAASANIQQWIFNYDGKLYFTAANDVFSPNSGLYGAPYVADPLANIYRSAAGIIKVDGSFIVGVDIGINGTLGVSGVASLTNATAATSGGSAGVIISGGLYTVKNVYIASSSGGTSVTTGDFIVANVFSVSGSNGNVYAAGQIIGKNGTAASPAFAFSSGPNAGIYNYDDGSGSGIGFAVNGSSGGTVNHLGNWAFVGSIATGNPSGGTAAAWKLGQVRAGVALAVSTTAGIQLDVAGTLYTLAILTTNP